MIGLGAASVLPSWGQAGRTEIARWQDGKRAAVSLTFDDNSINQFRVAVPILRGLGFPATFHIITGEISGSEFQGKFIGRATEAIIAGTADVPTTKDNFFERASAIGYLGLQGTLEYHTRAGELYEDGRIREAYELIDEAYSKVRRGAFKPGAESRAVPNARDTLTWDDLKRLAGQGFEFSSHTVTHARLAVLDEANLVYELEKSRQDILGHLGPKHTFTVECPYGTEDERVIEHALARYPASRNRMPDPFLDEINRGSDKDPAVSAKEYVQWQRGVLTKTPMASMMSWIDTAAGRDNIWLVLVFHGVDGIGWEPKTGAELKEYFDYIKSKEDRVWVADFQDVAKYMRERMRGTVRATLTGDVIEVSVAHPLQKDIYDLPLTLKTYIPAQWSAVVACQGSRAERLPALRDDKGSYVLYRAKPNAKPVRLSKGSE
jgi:peptidoglycan/xylan/chitin deacetylase (PgdA/CDA1 family)